MKKINEKLSQIFDVEPIKIEPAKQEIVPIESDNSVETDTDFARKNIRELIQKGGNAIDDLLQVAKHSESPRAYEVAANLIKNLSDLNKDLLEVQKRKKDLVADKGSSKDVNIDKAVFVGSTAELMKLIKSNK
jgi:Terminase DNA packaging enzyme